MDEFPIWNICIILKSFGNMPRGTVFIRHLVTTNSYDYEEKQHIKKNNKTVPQKSTIFPILVPFWSACFWTGRIFNKFPCPFLCGTKANVSISYSPGWKWKAVYMDTSMENNVFKKWLIKFLLTYSSIPCSDNYHEPWKQTWFLAKPGFSEFFDRDPKWNRVLLQE